MSASAANQATIIPPANSVESYTGRKRIRRNFGKIEEIARMLGGVSITQRSIAHASEMLIESQAGSTSS